MKNNYEFPDVKCDICGKIINMELKWDIIHGLTLCEEHLEQIEAVEKINSSFAIILCGSIYDKRNKYSLTK